MRLGPGQRRAGRGIAGHLGHSPAVRADRRRVGADPGRAEPGSRLHPDRGEGGRPVRRQHQHQEALRLLTHGLGDFDTAISYCLYGYSSIFRARARPGTLPVAAADLPPRAEQSRLFGFLLQEFLAIEDMSQRIERTGELLERFGGWFDVGAVLALLPDDWSVDIFSGFLINSLRRLVREKAESGVVRALSDAQNSQMSAELVERREKAGPTVEKVG